MKLSTTCIAALATCSTFLVAVSAAPDCKSVAATRNFFNTINSFLKYIPAAGTASDLITRTIEEVVVFEGCARNFRSNEDVIDTVECRAKNKTLTELKFLVNGFTGAIIVNSLPTPTDLNRYGERADVLERKGLSAGYQAALLNADLAVVKLAMFRSRYLSLEDDDEVNNAKRQAVDGIEKSLEYMKTLEEDLEKILVEKRKLVTERDCSKDKVVYPPFCGEEFRPCNPTTVCTELMLSTVISYGCDPTIYTYSLSGPIGDVPKKFPDENKKIKETKTKMRNKFFPTEYDDIKKELKVQRVSLCKELKEANFNLTLKNGQVLCDDEKKNKSFDAEL